MTSPKGQQNIALISRRSWLEEVRVQPQEGRHRWLLLLCVLAALWMASSDLDSSVAGWWQCVSYGQGGVSLKERRQQLLGRSWPSR
jgi:hypothetical protein